MIDVPPRGPGEGQEAPACAAFGRQPEGRYPSRACRRAAEGAGAWRVREERAAEITVLGRVRGLRCVLTALAAVLHLKGFTSGHCLVAAITLRLPTRRQLFLANI